jgi:bleomycin hydrolase
MARFIAVVLHCLAVGVSAQTVDDELATFIASKPHPVSVSEFQAIPHLSSLNQDTTLICWSFATSSFLESEMKRLGMPPVRLSVVYPMYCMFLEKTKRFVATKGESRVSPGDLFSGVLEVVRTYGAMPAATYEGMKEQGSVYSHTALYAEIQELMKRTTADIVWNEDTMMVRIKSILDRHVGTPPARFTYKGNEYTPESFAREHVRLPWQDYVLVTSFSYAPFDQMIEFRVPDNWMHGKNYLNVPLERFYSIMKNAVQRGYSMALDMDMSEPSYGRTKQYGIVLPSDVAEDSICQQTREVRFQDGRTTDDHLVHAVAYKQYGAEDWFLIKDSWRTAFEGPNGGYMFFHRSYMKLKVLAFLVHRGGMGE